jgi:hypothetical protein
MASLTAGSIYLDGHVVFSGGSRLDQPRVIVGRERACSLRPDSKGDRRTLSRIRGKRPQRLMRSCGLRKTHQGVAVTPVGETLSH